MLERQRKISDKLIFAANQRLKERDYWIKTLSGKLENVHIQYDHYISHQQVDANEPEPGQKSIKTGETAAIDFSLESRLCQHLVKLSSGADFRLHMILVTGVVILLYKYTGQKDIIVGAPIYKQERDLEFINTVLPLRSRLDESMTFKHLLITMRQTLARASENQNYPLEVLIDKLNLPAAGNYFPLFDTAVLVRNIHDKHHLDHIPLNMIFSFLRINENIDGTLEYNPGVYKKETMIRVTRNLQQLYLQTIANIDARITEIEILSGEERKQLLEEFNGSHSDLSTVKPLNQFITDQARQTPHRVALSYKSRELTYNHLDQQTNQLGKKLQECGITRDKLVGILLERSLLLAESILATWKAGGAYIPLEPGYPPNRIMDILADSSASVLLTQSVEVQRHLKGKYPGKIIFPQGELPAGTTPRAAPGPGTAGGMKSLAYVIYTSGSTGKPKGVMIEQIGMMNHIQAKINHLGLTGTNIIAQNASHTFDISIWQFFSALTMGGKTVIYPFEIILDPGKFISRLIDRQVDILEVTPSYLQVLLEYLPGSPGPNRNELSLSLAYLLVTGEEVKPQLVKNWFVKYPGIKMVNAYGPTEASDDITHHIMERAPARERTPIGKPLQNFDIYIVDNNMNLCPIGVSGEICVSGPGLARGYMNNVEKTQYQFPGNPFRKERGPILYRTGDIGQRHPNGLIDFLGRKDCQVKIRGFRIELGEIERQLETHEMIKEAVVVPRETKEKGQYLAAYYVPHPQQSYRPTNNHETGKISYREYLSLKLPGYMIPSDFINIEKMPLTANGKIDRNALESYEPASEPGKEYVEPANDMEKTIANIWQEVLKLDKVGIHDNFFEVGGNSLKVIHINSKLKEIFEKNIPVTALFEYTTIHSLAKYLQQYGVDESSTDIGDLRSREIIEGKARLKQRIKRRGGNRDD